MADSRGMWVDDLILDIMMAWGTGSCEQRGRASQWVITNPHDGRSITMPAMVAERNHKPQMARLKTTVGWEPSLALEARARDKARREQRDQLNQERLNKRAEQMRATQTPFESDQDSEAEVTQREELSLQERLIAQIEEISATAVTVGKHRYDEIILTADLARKLREHNREYSPVRTSRVHERTNRPKHPATTRRRWAAAMVNGQWELIPGGLAFDWYGYLLDGQNRLDAVLEAQEHWADLLDPTVGDYQKRRHDLETHGIQVPTVVSYDWDPDVFDRIDQGTPRNLGALLALEGFSDPKRLAAVVRLAYAYDHGMLDASDWRKRAPTDHVLLEYATNQPSLSTCLSEAWPMRTAHISLNGSAVALFVIRRTWPQTPAELAQGDVVAEWMTGLRQEYTLLEDGQRLPLEVGDPRGALRFYLRGRAAQKTRRLVGEHHLGLLIKCWNAWITDRKIQVITFGNSEEFPRPVERES